MKYPVRLAALFFAGGIWLSNICPLTVAVIPLMPIAGFLILLFQVISFFFRSSNLVSLRPLIRSILVYAAFFIAGCYCHRIYTDTPAHHFIHSIPRENPVSIAGQVTHVDRRTDRVHFTLAVHKVYHDSDSHLVQGRILVVHEKPPLAIMPGDVLLVNGIVHRVRGKRNPADFDYAAHLARNRLHAIVYPEDILLLNSSDSFGSWVQNARLQAHYVIGLYVEKYVEHHEARALLQALLLGEKSGISFSTLDHFRRTGLSHLLAVSGLHMLCIGLVFYTLMRPFCLRMGLGWWSSELFRTCATVVLLGLYMLITGPRPSIVRAFLMTAIVITAPLFQRPARTLNSLALAGIVLLALKPTFLFDPGFQLSFSAVAGIVTLAPLFNTCSSSWRVPGFIRSSFIVSLSATIGTVFITLLHFQTASTGGLLLNVLAIPLTTGVLLSGLLMLLFAPVLPILSYAFGSCTNALAWLLLEIPGATTHVLPYIQSTPAYHLRFLYGGAGLVVFLFCFCPFRVTWKYVCVLLFALSSMQWTAIQKGIHYPKVDVLFFDVGHGDAALVRLPGGKHVLIDTGDVTGKHNFNVPAHHVESFNVPCLDAIFLTHPHKDHIAGIHDFVGQECTPRLFTNGSNQYAQYLPSGLPGHQPIAAGDTLDLDPMVRIRVLGPCPEMEHHKDGNDGSLIVLLEYGDVVFLFSGDAETRAEQHLVAHYFPLISTSTVIKVGHHGSATSSSPVLMDALTTEHTPEWAIISTGASSRYGLPDPEIVHQWNQSSAHTHITHDSGALWLRTNGRAIYKKRW